MNNSLIYWGKRNKELNNKTLQTLKGLNKITVDYGDTSCKTPDAIKILSTDAIKKKFE